MQSQLYICSSRCHDFLINLIWSSLGLVVRSVAFHVQSFEAAGKAPPWGM